MLSNFFSGFDIPSIFDNEGMEKRRKKFDKHFDKQSNFLSHWMDDFEIFHQPSPAEIKENKLKQLQRRQQDIQERQKAISEYLEDLKKEEKAIHDKHEQLQKLEVEEPKKQKPSIKKIFQSDDEIDNLFEQFTKSSKKDKKKEGQMEEEKQEAQPPKLSKEQSIVRQEENTSKLSELKQKLTDQGFKCKENDTNDDKHWVVGKKKFVNDNNQKEKQVFYQIHDKSNPNCNYSGYTKQVRDDTGNFSTVKKSVYHYENL